jgi:Family of unknown function (DUF6065)
LKIVAHTFAGLEEPLIRPAPAERAWMDNSPQRFAYRCLPLNIANAHGWEIACPARVRAGWNGGPDLSAIHVDCDAPADKRPISHFGSGILTFHVSCLIRTPPGIELWVTGPANRAKHGISPLSGVVETDWAPYTFTMNWQFTAPGEVIFEKDEPFCFFFPISRQVLAAAEPEFRALSDDPKTEADYNAWRDSRLTFNDELKVQGSKAQEQRWQRGYFRGQTPSGTTAPEHRTRQRVAPFRRG